MSARKVYVASSWRNVEQPNVVRALRLAGHDVYDFRNPVPGNDGFRWSECAPTPPPWSATATRLVLNHPRAAEGFVFDFTALCWCDTIVMVQPCGRSAALELGYVCGLRDGLNTCARVVAQMRGVAPIDAHAPLCIALLADSQEPELMLKLADHVCVTIDEVIALLLGVQS